MRGFHISLCTGTNRASFSSHGDTRQLLLPCLKLKSNIKGPRVALQGEERTELPHRDTSEKSRKPHWRKRQMHQSLNSSLPACVLSPSATAFHPPALSSKVRRFTHWWLQEGWGELRQSGPHHEQASSSLCQASSQGCRWHRGAGQHSYPQAAALTSPPASKAGLPSPAPQSKPCTLLAFSSNAHHPLSKALNAAGP